ncbi:FAD/NAD(P)-binding domain-containing protein [Nadsonia fulvescens var. elongata DSM 6958]|uniref:NADH:ubiquinone reductase (non-electrogenic) n=1 Tax=Nadsonia fulvescens var. elongata DSM 6958 TaxID=857566 RepID=A0A1E3PS28_9ASCO|nr:FAD/NAD(P)-binding domain-containing protein [Nadsonia fulvescens var. elongata DSM 6958]
MYSVIRATRISTRASLPFATRSGARSLTSSAIRFNQGKPLSADPVERAKTKSNIWKNIKRTIFASSLLGLGYLGYGIYDERHPTTQIVPDAKKKTLVILGSGWGSISLLKKLDTTQYNVVLISPRNYFLFTPLLPSAPTGTVEHRSIIEPVHGIIRQKKGVVKYYEAEATAVDNVNKKVTLKSVNTPEEVEMTLDYDYIVMGVGAQTSTFGIPGVAENACFLKEIDDSKKLRQQLMDRIETAAFVSAEERKNLLHMVVVGGGPTGVEFAAELQDFVDDDLKRSCPEIAKDIRVTLVEALPNVLSSFSKQLVDYTQNSFATANIQLLTKTMVKNVTKDTIKAERSLEDGSKETFEIPYGLLVWATGNAVRPVTRSLMTNIEAQKQSRRGLIVNDFLVVEGAEGIWALGDCSATKFAPTAQVAAQEGAYLANLFNQMGRAHEIEDDITALQLKSESAQDSNTRKTIASEIESKTRKLRRAQTILPFEYTHQGSLAYIGSERAVADLSLWGNATPWAGSMTYWFWMSAYVSMCFNTRNRILVCFDWVKTKVFGRDISRE